ncbi:exonuclease [Salipiger sp.]|uniref:exonuclease n=1 Tax=Salipiger sp. TaxID=2078585 RepID=UPI003A9709E4
MSHAIVFDCEFLTAEGAPMRFWCGPHDPDPVIAQIGLVKLGLEEGFEVLDTRRLHVVPRNRAGGRQALDPLFVALTGITEDRLDREGTGLEQALAETEAFAGGARLWSWGKDEFNMVAISCYVEGLAPPIPVTRFGNACDLLLAAGMPYDELKTTRSDRLADHFGIEHPPLRGHDGLDDALSVAYVLQHFLRAGALSPEDFA